MPIPVTPRFKRLLETANPEQKKALGTSSVQSDSDTGDYHREKRASMPQAMRDIEYNYQDTEKMTSGEKYKYEFETFLRRSRDRYGNDPETLKFLDTMENSYYTNIYKGDLIRNVAQPAPDPFDVKANAIEPIMGPSDIIPDAVYNLTGSDLAAIVSGVLSPSQWIKTGAKNISKVYHGTTKVDVKKAKELLDPKYIRKIKTKNNEEITLIFDKDNEQAIYAFNEHGSLIGELNPAPLLGHTLAPNIPSQAAWMGVDIQYQRHGINTEMNKWMMELYPKYTPLSHTLTTEGQQWAKSMPFTFTERDQEVRKLVKLYKKIQRERIGKK